MVASDGESGRERGRDGERGRVLERDGERGRRGKEGGPVDIGSFATGERGRSVGGQTLYLRGGTIDSKHHMFVIRLHLEATQ